MLKITKNYIYLAEDKKEFTKLIKQALYEKSNILCDQRKKYALSSTWSKQIKKWK